MTHKKLTIIATAIALGLITSTAMANQGGHRRGGHLRGGGDARIFEDLNLSDTQKQQIAQIREKARNDSKAPREKIRKLNEQERAEWLKETPKKGNLIALNQQAHDIKQKLGEHRIETKFKTMAVLTKEQKAKMKAKKKNRPEDGKGRGFKGKRRGHSMGKKDKQFKNDLGVKHRPADTNRSKKRRGQAKQCVDTRLIETQKRSS